MFIQEFSPTHSNVNSTVIISIILLIAALIFLYFNQRRKVRAQFRNHRQLYSLLALLVAFTALLTAVFQWYINSRLESLVVYQDRLEWPERPVPWNEIKSVYFYDNSSTGRAGSSDRPIVEIENLRKKNQLLIIEEYSGKTHVFAQKDYAIIEMYKVIGDQLNRYRKKKE